jgi:uncharacterized protein YbjT (DUF2867 family)
MNVIIFGATGMVGQAALRESLLDPGVERVLAVGRRPTGQKHDKLRELVLADLTDYSAVSGDLAGYDACFFCLGVSSAGMSEADYRRVTVDITAAAGRALAQANPAMTFIFVSGTGTDSTGKSRTMWARVKGEAENAVFALPFKAAYAFRPAFIRPMHGITSRTRSYRVMYAILWPLVPAFVALFPRLATTTEKIGRAMLNVARRGAPKRILDTPDINAVAEATGAA